MSVIVLGHSLFKTAYKTTVDAPMKESSQQVHQKLAVNFQYLVFRLMIIGSFDIEKALSIELITIVQVYLYLLILDINSLQKM
jgi:hypothetical protein